MKLIAKTQKGTEFLHSRNGAYFAPDSSADKIAKIMNDNKYKLKAGFSTLKQIIGGGKNNERDTN